MTHSSSHRILSLLRRWLRGETRASDEHELDEAAAGDEFLRDALQGYRQHPEGDHVGRLAGLRSRLDERTGRRREGVIVLWLPRMTAAAAGMLAIAATAWWLLRPPAAGNLAVGKTTAGEATPAAPNQAFSLDTATALAGRSEPAPTEEGEHMETPVAPGRPPIAATRQKPPAASTGRDEQPEVSTVPSSLPSPVELAAAEAEKKEEAGARPVPDTFRAPAQPPAPQSDLPPARAAEPSAGYTARSLNVSPPPGLVTGIVTSADGEPIIGASIQVKGTTQGTVTDLDGRFRLTLPQPDQYQTLEINYTGFNSQEVGVKPSDSLRIVLAPGADVLSELVITKPGKERMKKANKPAIPEPEGGFRQFERYLKKNLRYPDAARQQGVEGEVVLRFQVSADGSLADIQVQESLGYGCDAEAIRLLRDGPKWILAPGSVSSLTTYAVRFDLP